MWRINEQWIFLTSDWLRIVCHRFAYFVSLQVFFLNFYFLVSLLIPCVDTPTIKNIKYIRFKLRHINQKRKKKNNHILKILVVCPEMDVNRSNIVKNYRWKDTNLQFYYIITVELSFNALIVFWIHIYQQYFLLVSVVLLFIIIQHSTHFSTVQYLKMNKKAKKKEIKQSKPK